MSLINRIKPKFWDHHDASPGHHSFLINFRKKWKLIVLLMTLVTITPMIVMTAMEYRLTRKTMEKELAQRTFFIIENTRRAISLYIDKRKSAMEFILADNDFNQLRDSNRLGKILNNLKAGIDDFEDMGIIDSSGHLTAYSGPYLRKGLNLSNDRCFQEAVRNCIFVTSPDAEGLNRQGQIIIALKAQTGEEDFFVFRAALRAGPLRRLLSEFETAQADDVFLIDENGVLQTPSFYHGQVGKKIGDPVLLLSSENKLTESVSPKGDSIIIGHAAVPGTSFILMFLRDGSMIMKQWYKPRLEMIGFLVLGIAIIVFSILAASTFFVNRIHAEDQKRIVELHDVEYANKLASIERLAAGLAHEINNPLAIINEKAGLMRDLFTLQEKYAEDEKITGLVNSIIASVDRCAAITKRLLNFARHIDITIQSIDVGDLIQGMVDFISKEADLRGIDIRTNIPEFLPPVENDHSHLQQIFLNILNNSFAAVSGGGVVGINVKLLENNALTVIIEDDGCGIPKEDLKHVFEPFFTTRSESGGTGLGLSITHGLIQKIGGQIEVESEVDEGTRFIVTLPLEAQYKKNIAGNENDSIGISGVKE